MRLYLKQMVFSFRDRFTVKDETGADRFFVEGEIFTWGKRLHVFTPDGNGVAFIKQKVLSFLPRFFVEINGTEVCEIIKEFTFLRQSYRLEGTNWHLEGDFFAHEYTLVENGAGARTVMRLSKKWFSWGDSYELDIENPQDILLCLCIALAVDCALASQSRHGGR
ncbi:MAG: LURP-one-related family protein [Defluviitaleaceae bacterium]|nr:LURP-one-related family protein [Defluviitaleaceae bacterium]